MPRKLTKPWIDSYLEYILPYSQSPPEFHFWSAATVLGSSLKRHVWTTPKRRELYPNLYTVLVGRPATGKGESIDPAIEILKEANTSNILSDRLTIEYVLEKLSKGFPSTSIAAGNLTVGIESSAIIFAPELSVFLRSGSDALSDLSQLWDNRSMDYGTRSKGLYTVKDPCPSILGGSSAGWLAKSIPQDAVGGGFTRRVNFVYTKNDPIFPEWGGITVTANGNRQRFDDLVEDLRHIAANLHGKVEVDNGFISVFNAYTKGIKIEDFDDEAITGFKASKWLNATKLAMIIGLSRSDDMVLNADDMAQAIVRIDKVEEDLQLVFRAVGESDDAVAAGKILEFVEKRGMTTFGDIMHGLWRHVTRDDAMRIISAFIEGGLIREKVTQGRVIYTFNAIRKGNP